MGTYRLLIWGEVFEIGTTDRKNGIDYINIVDIRDGWTDRQFEAIKPFVVRAVEVLGPESILAAVDYSGLVKWDTHDMYGTDWAYKMQPPKYISSGPQDRALTVGFDRTSIVLMDTAGGKPAISKNLTVGAIGKPIWKDGYFYVPVDGGIIGLDISLSEVFRLDAKGIEGSAELVFAKDALYIIDGNTLVNIAL